MTYNPDPSGAERMSGWLVTSSLLRYKAAIMALWALFLIANDVLGLGLVLPAEDVAASIFDQFAQRFGVLEAASLSIVEFVAAQHERYLGKKVLTFEPLAMTSEPGSQSK